MKNDYDEIAEDWASARADLQLPRDDRELLERFVDTLPQSPKVLDLGCGTGIPIADLLVDRGADVVGVDRSKGLLDLARSNVPAADFVHGDVVTFNAEGRYDGVVLWDVIFHIERHKHRDILERIAGWLRPQGLLIVTSGGSDHPPFTDVMFGQEFFYDAHPPEAFRQLCRAVGFEVIELDVLDEPDGERNKGRIGALLRLDTVDGREVIVTGTP